MIEIHWAVIVLFMFLSAIAGATAIAITAVLVTRKGVRK